MDINLDLKPLETDDLAGEEATQVKAAPPSPTVLSLDKWGMRRGREVAQKIHQHFGRDDVDESIENATADFFGAAFEYSPEIVDNCEDELRREFMGTLMDTADFRVLRKSTLGDSVSSEIASAAFAQHFTEFIAGREEKSKPPADDFDEQQQGLEQELGLDGVGAATKALGTAQRKIDELNDAKDGLGCGKGDGTGGTLSPDEVAALFRQLQANPRLKQIFDAAGRFRRVARSLQRKKRNDAREDLVGITQGNDPSRFIPSELALLDTELEDDLLIRMAEKRVLSWEYRGEESVAKGPVILFCDESGSMGGGNIEKAKGLALTMAWIAQHQKRWCCLVGFSGSPGTPLIIPPGKRDHNTLIKWALEFQAGGTSFEFLHGDYLGRFYTEHGVPDGATDIILVSDGICRISREAKASWQAFREEHKAKLFTLLLGCQPNAEIEEMSAKAYRIDLSADDAGIHTVLSI